MRNLFNMYTIDHRRHKRDKWNIFINISKPPSLYLSHVTIKKITSSLFSLFDQALGSTVLVGLDQRRLILLIDLWWISHTYHPFNYLLSGKCICDIHCDKEYGHIDIVVPCCNNIDMTMTTNNSLLSFWSTM